MAFGLACERHSRNMTFNVKRIEIYMLKCFALHFNRLVNCVHIRTPIEHTLLCIVFSLPFLSSFNFHNTDTIDTLNHIFGWLKSFFMLLAFLIFEAANQNWIQGKSICGLRCFVHLTIYNMSKTKHITNAKKKNSEKKTTQQTKTKNISFISLERAIMIDSWLWREKRKTTVSRFYLSLHRCVKNYMRILVSFAHVFYGMLPIGKFAGLYFVNIK